MQGVHARGVGRRSTLAARAMRTGRPTGVPCASRGREERGDRARKWTGDPVAEPAPHAACVLPRAFAAVSHELDDGGDVPFSFEEHQAPGSPTLYEYRPLVKPFL